MIRYTVSYSNPLSHILNIAMIFESEAKQAIEVMLPTWRPGRYEAGDFSKNILSVSASGSINESLPVKKVSKSCWQLEIPSKQVVSITYQFYAYKMDAGSSWLHDDQLYVNPVNCLMYLPERMNEAIEIELQIPADYEIACALPQAGRRLLASTFYEVADSPFFASPKLTHLTYQLKGITFHIWYHGVTDVSSERMEEDFSKFSDTQLELFGELPVTDYHFLLQFLPYPAYHGVEHAASTVITLGPGTGEQTEEFYERLLGISSHELFHAWNITRIRPQELTPYDFSKENYFETGYVAEGFTTYYGDLMLVKSGVYDETWYLKELNRLLNRHFQNFGRFNQSVAESSFDLWLDGYQAGTPNRKVSIYVKGAIIALMLDFTIRLMSENRYSLDDLMRRLWGDYFKEGKGYTKIDIQSVAEALTGTPLAYFFEQFVDGNQPVEKELAVLGSQFGLTLNKAYPDSIHERDLGFKMKLDKDRWVVSHVHPKSSTYQLLSIDDEIKSVNGETDRHKIDSAFTAKAELQIIRHATPLSLHLSSNGLFYETHVFERKESMSANESANFKRWLMK